MRFRTKICSARSQLFTNPITGQLNIVLPDGKVLGEDQINGVLVSRHAKLLEVDTSQIIGPILTKPGK